MVYDCVDMRDGELMINSGVCNPGPKGKLSFAGGIDSLLPFIELMRAIAALSPTTVRPSNFTPLIGQPGRPPQRLLEAPDCRDAVSLVLSGPRRHRLLHGPLSPPAETALQRS